MKEHLTIAKFKPFYDTIFSQPSNKNPFNKVMKKKSKGFFNGWFF